MKILLRSLAVAFSMYSRIPMPRTNWDKESMRYAILFFPLVGTVIAAALFGLMRLFGYLGLSPVFSAVILTAAPLFITGGIHLDGFCDTCDALASHADRERKLTILKDPHIGAFGVIGLCVLLLLQLGAWHQICGTPAFFPPVCAGYVLSRTLAGLAVLRFPKTGPSGLAAVFSVGAAGGLPAALLLVAVAVTLLTEFLPPGLAGLLIPACYLLCFVRFRHMALRGFGGITGDLAGYFISASETAALLLAALLGAAL